MLQFNNDAVTLIHVQPRVCCGNIILHFTSKHMFLKQRY